jgi:hypothetical protein
MHQWVSIKTSSAHISARAAPTSLALLRALDAVE